MVALDVMNTLLVSETCLPLKAIPLRLKRSLRGAVRVVDPKGHTFGLFLDKTALEELSEELAYRSPAFAEELERSRASGEVSAKTIERRLRV